LSVSGSHKPGGSLSSGKDEFDTVAPGRFQQLDTRVAGIAEDMFYAGCFQVAGDDVRAVQDMSDQAEAVYSSGILVCFEKDKRGDRHER